jgi:hypothetical protein
MKANRHPLCQYGPGMRFALLFTAALPLASQPLPVKAPGDPVTLKIFATSLPDRAPVELKWEVVFPAQLMDLEGAPEAGAAAVNSGKSLKCERQKQRDYAYACVLSGGNKPIADGQMAAFHFRIRPDATPGRITLTIQRAAAMQKAGFEAPLKNTESSFIIR